MRSQHILYLHIAFLVMLVFGSLSSPFLALRFKNVYSSSYYLPAVIVFLLLVIGSWRLYKGCPFTVWENGLKKTETGRDGYLGGCITHYCNEWFGIRIPPKLVTSCLVILLVIPILVGIIN